MRESKENWKDLKKELGITKQAFGKKISFITEDFQRQIIFRDVEQAFRLACLGYAKPAVILAGGVIEELLRQYIQYKGFKPKSDRFEEYIDLCEKEKLLKSSISNLSDSVRQFRNLVHVSAEKDKKYVLSKATAKAAVASIFTIANDF